MKKTWMHLFAGLLAVMMLAGCAPAGEDARDTTPPTKSAAEAPTEAPTEVISDQPAPTEGTLPQFVGKLVEAEAGLGSVDCTQLRLGAEQIMDGWWNRFANGYLLCDSVESLHSKLTACGIDPEKSDLQGFDQKFFSENRLVVLPRTSNTGSVRYSAHLVDTNGGVKVVLTAHTPEAVTWDMADFLVLVPVPLAKYPANVTITVDPAGSPSGTGGAVTE